MDVVLGTKIKLNIHIDKYDGLSMSEYNFDAKIYTPRSDNSIFYEKEDMIKIDDDNYCVLVDTSIIGLGRIYVRIHAYLDDFDFEDSIRDEICVYDTMLNIVK
ncbi:MAG: hypothetical protein ACI4N3_00855 [Alphaproteobacteria bacterium]